MKRLPSLLLLLSLAGCFGSHGPDRPSPDAGGDTPAPTCTDGIEWLDATSPWVRPADATSRGAPAITADAEGFLVIGVDHTGILDLAHCVTVARVPERDVPAHVCADLAPTWAAKDEPRAFAGTSPDGIARVALAFNDTLWWGGDDGVADGSIATDRVLGAVAFDDGGVLVETHERLVREDVLGPTERSVASIVRRHPFDGTAPETLTDLDPSFGSDYWSPRLAVTADGPWLAILNDVDFPPTVQVSGPAGGGWDGSSCGVESYDLVAESGEVVVVSQDCGDEVRVQRRRVDARERDAIALPGRDAASGIPSRIASDGERFVVAYRGADGDNHVVILDAALSRLAEGVVPVNDESLDPFAGPLAVAAMPDGTYAVMSTFHTGTARFGELEVQRFRLCE